MQVTDCSEILQVQPVPLADSGISPGGTLSIRVTVPVVADPPVFRTVKVKSRAGKAPTPLGPWVNVAVWVLVTVKSGPGVILAESLAVLLRH
jgi:hypothetical protein